MGGVLVCSGPTFCEEKGISTGAGEKHPKGGPRPRRITLRQENYNSSGQRKVLSHHKRVLGPVERKRVRTVIKRKVSGRHAGSGFRLEGAGKKLRKRPSSLPVSSAGGGELGKERCGGSCCHPRNCNQVVPRRRGNGWPRIGE